MIRIDDNRLSLEGQPFPVIVLANRDVHIDNNSVEELRNFVKLSETLDQLNRIGYLSDARIDQVLCTPDFHAGADIPIGTTVDAHGFVCPGMIGNDVACGMRLLTTDVTEDELVRLRDPLFDVRLRYIVFEGGRNIPLSAVQREAIFREGLLGLLNCPHSNEGIWRYWDADQQWDSANNVYGNWSSPTVFGLQDYLRGSGSGADFTRDDQIGTIGGGNHFTEIQRVDEVFDRHRAFFMGLRPGTVTIMVHTGSVSIGHMVGQYFSELARRTYPSGLKHGQFFMLPVEGMGQDYLNSMVNAANFAQINRMFISLMIVRAMSEQLGRTVGWKLVADVPHNFAQQFGNRVIHRKGACPAHNMPVIVPGSMGARSFVMWAEGGDIWSSACHGAGRIARRQSGRHTDYSELERLRVVSKIDLAHARPDIADQLKKSLCEEAPSMYKPVMPAIDTIEGAGVARKVASVWPLLTIKGC